MNHRTSQNIINKKRLKQFRNSRVITTSLCFAFIIVLALIAFTSCSSGKEVAKIYSYENGERVKLQKTVFEKNEDFLFDLLNVTYSLGNATGAEEPNYTIVYNEGVTGEYEYKLIVDLETDIVTIITDDNDGVTAPKLLNSYTTALDFYDFISKK
ncbi:MAG: hypothetical protein PHY15_03775 [Eubacteriales bacterium]|nr:hypothetical protein [Eubacteriales bacterium]MDD4475826.1 hypothetical protein [Eubacteriales bacterium]